jgi:hypothetical protein
MQPPTDRAHPVFVDRTGRRRRVLTIAGCAGGLLLTITTVGLLSGFTGIDPATLPGLPFGKQPAVAVQPAPSPDGLPNRSGAGHTPPSGAATRTAGTPASTSPPAPSNGNSRRNVPTQTPSHRGKPK